MYNNSNNIGGKMMRKNKMVAMVLAGGRGSRLFDLTKKVAKPAVHYGGKYRIVDFCLSNCANSDISVVGVLTQYESILLNSYVSRDHHWGLDAKDGGIFVLPPREKDDKGFGIYRGTADAISQNIDFLDQEEAEYVLILSGDHIYKMNYAKMLQTHKETKADCTIAVLQVPLHEASRFGIMNCNDKDEVVEFEEKPQNPKSDLASMGIYIFNYKKLREYLLKDEKNPDSEHDFGKDIIPAFISDGLKVQAYRFKGYWKDVGTINSLWEANMDLLAASNELDLFDPSWKIYTQDGNAIPQYIGENAELKNAYITQGCVVDGHVEGSVLFTDVVVETDAEVKNTVVMNKCHIGKGAKLNYCIVMDDTRIPAGFVGGGNDEMSIELITASSIKKAGVK